MNRDQVNTRNTPTWGKVNDDAKSSFWRKHFCDLYGGKFTHIDKKWQWQEKESTTKKKIQSYTYTFSDPDGALIEVNNMMKFCREKSLNKSAVYELISGKRNHHKNFRFVEKKITI